MTAASVPVDQDSTGASAAVPPAPKACVRESPRAAIAVGGAARAAGALMPATTAIRTVITCRAERRCREFRLFGNQHRAISPAEAYDVPRRRDLDLCVGDDYIQILTVGTTVGNLRRGGEIGESGHLRRPTTESLTAIVVDRHPIMRSGIADALARGGFEIVADGAALADIPRPTRRVPAAILVGWDAQNRDIEGLRRIVAAEPASKVVVLAPSPTPDDVYQAFAAGASAVILKTVDPEDLAPLIRQVVDENIIVAPVQDEAVPADAIRLTPRERQVLSRVASGASNATVAVQLWLSEATVKFHLRNIYRKLGANGRTEASRLAYELDLIPRSHTH